MGSEIEVRIKQDFINLKVQSVPPTTDNNGVIFLNKLDNKIKFREPNNGLIYNIPTTEYRGKELNYVEQNDTNGLGYWVGTQYGKTAWSNPAGAGLYISNSSSAEHDPYLEQNVVLGRSEITFSTYDYPESWLGVYLSMPEKMLLNGIFIQSPNTEKYGFIQQWNVSVDQPSFFGGQVIYVSSDPEALNGINKKLYIPFSNLTKPAGAVYINHLGLNSIGTNNLALAQIELYGIFA